MFKSEATFALYSIQGEINANLARFGIYEKKLILVAMKRCQAAIANGNEREFNSQIGYLRAFLVKER